MKILSIRHNTVLRSSELSDVRLYRLTDVV